MHLLVAYFLRKTGGKLTRMNKVESLKFEQAPSCRSRKHSERLIVLATRNEMCGNIIKLGEHAPLRERPDEV